MFFSFEFLFLIITSSNTFADGINMWIDLKLTACIQVIFGKSVMAYAGT